jgi:PAS domain S-box-containing protein
LNVAQRNTGIKALGQVPWGTHFCQFYRTHQDLLDILVPYFKAGLEANEACIWVCSEPLCVEDSTRALGKVVPDLAARMRKGQIEILPHDSWYLRRGRFGAKRVLKAWADRLDAALAAGYEGLRLSGNTFWLEKKDWARFTDYEAEVDAAVHSSRMLALCTYSLDRCGPQEIIDVLNNHKQTLIRRSGKWTLVESSVRKTVESDLIRSEQRFREIFEESPIGIELYDAEGRLVEINQAAMDIFGIADPSEVRGFRLFDDPNLSSEARARLKRGRPFRYEIPFDFGKVRRQKLYRTRRSGIIDLDVQIMPVGGRARERSGYLVQVQDLSLRKRAEAELGESQRRLKTLFESDIIGIATISRDRVHDANAAFLRITGYDRKDLEAGRVLWRSMTPPEFRRRDEEAAKWLKTRGTARPFEKEYVRKDGSCVPLLVGAAVIERSPLRWECFVLDISKQKGAERSLREALDGMERKVRDRTADLDRAVAELRGEVAERRLTERSLRLTNRILDAHFTSGLSPLVILDRNFNFVRVNEAYAKACERKAGDFLGHNHFELFPSPENEAIFRRVVRLRKPFQVKAKPFAYPDHPEWGVTYWDWTLDPVLDDRGRVEYLVFALNDVTQETRAHEEVRRNESLLREQATLLELASDAIIVRDSANRIIFWNHGAEVVYGWPKEEALGKITHTLLRTRFPEPLEKIENQFAKGHHWEGELVHARSDGREIVVESRWVLLKGQEGRPATTLEINRDITARKIGMEAMRRSSFYTRGLIEASLDPLVAISPAGKITDVNKATELATGLPRTELIGSDFSDYFTEPAKARAGYEKVFSEGSVRDYPLAIRHVSGRVTEVLYNAVVFKDEAGATVGVFAAARDVAALRAAEQERLRLATAIEQIKDGVSILDLEGRVLSANPAFAGHHGFRQNEIIGRPLHEVLAVDPGEMGILDEMRGAVSDGRTWSAHFSRTMPPGGGRELDLTVSPIRDFSGRAVNLIAVERDVTQEVIFQERIRQWQKMEALGTLAGGIAHDLNNLLLPIMINTELTLDEGKADAPTSHRLSQVLEAARRGQDMVKQIIAFSQRREQERRAVEIVPVIRESLEFLRVSLPKNIRISERFEAASARAYADPTQIHQVIVNLGSNASHAMREKGGVLEVGLAVTRLDEASAAQFIDLGPGDYLRLTVKDTGHGMTPDISDRIFEPFYTTKKTGEGTGMGLAVVHGIVKSHGGAISVQSEPGKGTTFTILLPRALGTPEAGKEEAPVPYPKGSERVLFVDDEDIQVRAMGRLLEHLGYRVTGMTDSREALEILRRDPDAFDLVILDQTMPNLPGTEVARETMALRPDLPIILCTGYSETIDEEQALAMGIRAFMLKPFSARDIAVAIRRVLARKA